MICLVEKHLARTMANGVEYASSPAKTKHGTARLSWTPQDFLVSWTCLCGGAITWAFSDPQTAGRWASLICQEKTAEESGATHNAIWMELSLPSGRSWSQPWETVDQVGVLMLRVLPDGRLLVSFLDEAGKMRPEERAT